MAHAAPLTLQVLHPFPALEALACPLQALHCGCVLLRTGPRGCKGPGARSLLGGGQWVTVPTSPVLSHGVNSSVASQASRGAQGSPLHEGLYTRQISLCLRVAYVSRAPALLELCSLGSGDGRDWTAKNYTALQDKPCAAATGTWPAPCTCLRSV